MPKTLLLLLFSFASILLRGANSTTITVKNNCGFTVWPGVLSNPGVQALPDTGFELAPGATQTLDAPPKWGGRVWGRYNCLTNASGKFTCASGDCASGQIPCSGAGGIPPATLAEFTLQGDADKDFYDVSCVDGFNLPMSIVPQGGSGCTDASCPSNINALCPKELVVMSPDNTTVVACKSACLAFNTDEYCCRGEYGTPDKCKPSTFAQTFKNACPLAYCYAYDDSSSLKTCLGPPSYLITFCP